MMNQGHCSPYSWPQCRAYFPQFSQLSVSIPMLTPSWQEAAACCSRFRLGALRLTEDDQAGSASADRKCRTSATAAPVSPSKVVSDRSAVPSTASSIGSDGRKHHRNIYQKSEVDVEERSYPHQVQFKFCVVVCHKRRDGWSSTCYGGGRTHHSNYLSMCSGCAMHGRKVCSTRAGLLFSRFGSYRLLPRLRRLNRPQLVQ